MRKLIIAAAALLLAAGPASAEDIGGLWLSAEGREGGCAIVEFVQDICILANVDDTQNPNICSYDDFTASLSATLLIPEITTSDPLDILLVRSPAECP